MRRNRLQKTGSFYALDEQGNRHRIHEFTDYADSSNLGAYGRLAVGSFLLTDRSEHVNEVGDGWYQVVTTSLKLFRLKE